MIKPCVDLVREFYGRRHTEVYIRPPHDGLLVISRQNQRDIYCCSVFWHGETCVQTRPCCCNSVFTRCHYEMISARRINFLFKSIKILLERRCQDMKDKGGWGFCLVTMLCKSSAINYPSLVKCATVWWSSLPEIHYPSFSLSSLPLSLSFFLFFLSVPLSESHSGENESDSPTQPLVPKNKQTKLAAKCGPRR